MSTSCEPKSEGRSLDVVKTVEFGIALSVNRESLSPKKNEGYYCHEMDVNRALVTTALSVYCASGISVFTPVKCIDVIGSTGIAGLLWKKYLGDAVNVYINDPHEKCFEIVTANRNENNLNVEVMKRDPCVLLQEIPFSFIHLDCHTEAAFYLDSLMRNIPKQGLLAITTKDDGALYGRTPEMALRNYGGAITRTFYAKELAARLIIAGMVRSAAVHSKGLEILCVMCVKSTITIIAKVIKRPAHASSCMAKVRRFVHCNLCEDRAFYPSSVYAFDNPGKLLSCKCSEQYPGKSVVDLGPVWCGNLYDFNFLLNMNMHLANFPWKNNLSELMETLLTEAWCPKLEDGKTLQALLTNKSDTNGKTRDATSQSESDVQEPPSKKQKAQTKETLSPYEVEPTFYFNLHKHCPKGPKMVRAGKIVSLLQKFGYRASRTHFDPLAVRTSAGLTELRNIVVNISD